MAFRDLNPHWSLMDDNLMPSTTQPPQSQYFKLASIKLKYQMNKIPIMSWRIYVSPRTYMSIFLCPKKIFHHDQNDFPANYVTMFESFRFEFLKIKYLAKSILSITWQKRKGSLSQGSEQFVSDFWPWLRRKHGIRRKKRQKVSFLHVIFLITHMWEKKPFGFDIDSLWETDIKGKLDSYDEKVTQELLNSTNWDYYILWSVMVDLWNP